METHIGEICNYYGGLSAKEENGQYWWGIESCDRTYWEQIPESLYKALMEYELNREEKNESK